MSRFARGPGSPGIDTAKGLDCRRGRLRAPATVRGETMSRLARGPGLPGIDTAKGLDCRRGRLRAPMTVRRQSA
jgi:hypothetical protein